MHYTLLVIVMKKLIGVFTVIAVLTLALHCITVSAEAEDAVSPGPKPGSGDSIPDGNQDIQPETPGKGPAPNAGSGLQDGSGF
jgi:hypothetical protein